MPSHACKIKRKAIAKNLIPSQKNACSIEQIFKKKDQFIQRCQVTFLNSQGLKPPPDQQSGKNFLQDLHTIVYIDVRYLMHQNPVA